MKRKTLSILTILAISTSSLPAYAEQMTLQQGEYGVDVSEHNQPLDFATLKTQGNKYAMIRLGYGAQENESQRDKALEKHVKSARDSRTPILAFYHYSYAKTLDQAKSEADQSIRHLQLVNAEKGSYVVYDIEQFGKTAVTDDLNEMIKAYFDKIVAAGYKPMLYTGYNFYYENLDAEKMKDYDKWIAHYGAVQPANNENELLKADPTLKDKINAIPNTRVWQFSSTSTWSGYSGNLDKNVLLTDVTFQNNLPAAEAPTEYRVEHIDERGDTLATERFDDEEKAKAARYNGEYQFKWLRSEQNGNVIKHHYKRKYWNVIARNETTGETIDTVHLTSPGEFDAFDYRKYENAEREFLTADIQIEDTTYTRILKYRNRAVQPSQPAPIEKKYKVRHIDEATGEEISAKDVENLEAANNDTLDEETYFYKGSATKEELNVVTVTKKWSKKSWTVKYISETGEELATESLNSKKEYDEYQPNEKEYVVLESKSTMKNGVYEKTYTVKKHVIAEVEPEKPQPQPKPEPEKPKEPEKPAEPEKPQPQPQPEPEPDAPIKPEKPVEKPKEPEKPAEPEKPKEEPQKPSEKPAEPEKPAEKPKEEPQKPSEKPQKPSKKPAEKPKEKPKKLAEETQKPSEKPSEKLAERPKGEPQKQSDKTTSSKEEPQIKSQKTKDGAKQDVASKDEAINAKPVANQYAETGEQTVAGLSAFGVLILSFLFGREFLEKRARRNDRDTE